MSSVLSKDGTAGAYFFQVNHTDNLQRFLMQQTHLNIGLSWPWLFWFLFWLLLIIFHFCFDIILAPKLVISYVVLLGEMMEATISLVSSSYWISYVLTIFETYRFSMGFFLDSIILSNAIFLGKLVILLSFSVTISPSSGHTSL